MVKRAAAGAAFLLILAGGFQTYYLRAYTLGGEPKRRYLTELPYRKLPGFRAFMTRVRESTPPASAIAVAIPVNRWNAGYEYGYYRSAYLLAGRQPVPLIDPANRSLPSNLAAADYVACYRCEISLPGLRLVFRTEDGVLARLR